MNTMATTPNFSVERMAAGGAPSQIRVLGARRHRSPLRLPRNTQNNMKRILLPFFASFFLCACSFAADEPKVTLGLKNAEVQQVLPVYKAMSGLDLVVDSRVKSVRWPVTLQSSEALPKAEATKLIEKALLEQAGVVITHLDGQRASVTHNDALAVTPAKK